MLKQFMRKAGIGKPVDFSCIKVAYKSKDGSWRGFINPYDISIDGESKEQVCAALDDLLDAYIEVLEEYDFPTHLTTKRLTNDEDHDKYIELVSLNLVKKGLTNTDDLYVEAKNLQA